MKYKSLLILFIFYSLCSCTFESSNREKTAIAFEENFGFIPPKEIKIIKLRNTTIRDNVAHWMAFTYDSISFEKIIEHDKPLKVLSKSSSDYQRAIKSLTTGANIPLWFDLRNLDFNKIYFKENFLEDISYSEYYLLVDDENKIIYLHVSYF